MLNPSLVILYEDSDCLAVAKPAGQFTQGNWAPPGEIDAGDGDPPPSQSRRSGIGLPRDRPPAGPADVRRLDLGKDGQGGPPTSSQFEKRRVVKEYWAIVAPGFRDRDSSTSRRRTASAWRGTEETWSDWLTASAARPAWRSVVAPKRSDRGWP